jgi:shikimate dehydrogenase
MELPRRFVVIGNPIAHSKSPSIHRDFAQQLGLCIQYEKLLAPLDGFANTVAALQAAGVSGANVTVPFKQQAFALAHERSSAAAFAQAANTLVFRPQGLLADNTDGGGLCRDLNRLLAQQGLTLSKTHVLMLGAGGAASGCIAAFKENGVQHLTILNRTEAKAQALAQRAQQFGLACDAGGLQAQPNGLTPEQPLVIVNASASSLNAEVPALHPVWYEHAVLAYDMMYAAADTPFVAHAKSLHKASLQTSDGLGMLVFQAELAFETWTGQRPDGLSTLQRLRTELTQQQ